MRRVVRDGVPGGGQAGVGEREWVFSATPPPPSQSPPVAHRQRGPRWGGETPGGRPGPPRFS